MGLDAERLNLEGLVFSARSVVDGLYAGGHVSARHGGGVEFQDYRAYSPGDDLRGIDWKVFGRTDRYYLKRYRHETDLNLHVALDCSASMGFAALDPRGARTITKFEVARQVAAALLMLVVGQGDRAGLALLGAGARDRIAPAGGGAHLRRLMAGLDQAHTDAAARGTRATPNNVPGASLPGDRPGPSHHPTNNGNRIASGLGQLQASLTRRGVVVVISDLLDEPDVVFAAIDRLRFAGSEVVAVQVLARDEVDLGISAGPGDGAPSRKMAAKTPFARGAALRLIDPETQHSVSAQTGRVASAYRQLMGEHQATLERGLAARGCDYLRVMTDRPIPEALRAYLAARAQRQG